LLDKKKERESQLKLKEIELRERELQVTLKELEVKSTVSHTAVDKSEGPVFNISKYINLCQYLVRLKLEYFLHFKKIVCSPKDS